MSSAGPSRPTQRPSAPPATSSPLPQPIRRAVRAAQVNPPVTGPKAPAPTPAPAQPQAQIPKVNPRAKSVFGSFRSLTPNQRILIGLVGITIGGAGLLVDRFVLPTEGDEKPLIAVRTVDRD